MSKLFGSTLYWGRAGFVGGDEKKKIPNNFLPFDGTCRCSADGDLTLAFQDGSSLKVETEVLKVASPVFKEMLQCRESSPLHFEKTSRDAWIVILNEIHPRSAASVLGLSTFDVELLEDVIEQSEKYGIELVLERVDVFLGILVEMLPIREIHKPSGTKPASAVSQLVLRAGRPESQGKLLRFVASAVKEKQTSDAQSNSSFCPKCIRQKNQHPPCQCYANAKTFLDDLLSRASAEFVRSLLDKLVDGYY